MLLLTTAILAIATTSPDAQVEKKLPLTTEVQQEIQVTEEPTSEELVLNDLVVLEALEDASEEE